MHKTVFVKILSPVKKHLFSVQLTLDPEENVFEFAKEGRGICIENLEMYCVFIGKVNEGDGVYYCEAQECECEFASMINRSH